MDTAYILQVLLPYLVGLYIIDSITYVGRHQHLFISPLGNRFKMRSGGFRLAGISPLCQAVHSHALPIFMTREGVYLPANRDLSDQVPYQKDDLRYFPYSELRSVEAAGNSIRINGSFSLKTPLPGVARIIAGRLEDLRSAKEQDREDLYRAMLDEMTDTSELARVRAELSRPLFAIGLISSTLFLLTFFLLPLAVYRLVSINVSYLLLFMAPVYFAIVGSTCFVHRRFFPPLGQERMYLLFTMLLLPVSAIHAVSRLTRDMCAGYDFLAVAAVLLPKDTLRALLRKEFEITRVAIKGDMPGDLKQYWSEREDTLYRLVEGAGLSREEICREPAKKDSFAKTYCPLCGAEYRAGFDRCADCSVDLVAFERAGERERELSA